MTPPLADRITFYTYRNNIEILLMTESDIKIHLLEYLNTFLDDLIIALEVPFQFNERRADVVVLSQNNLIAYEIKTRTDKIDRLSYQLESYKKMFDYCFVVCEKENLSAVRKFLSHDHYVGLLVVSNKEIKQIRKPRKISRHDKSLLADFISHDQIKDKLTNMTAIRKMSSYERAIAVSKRLTANTLHQMFKEEFLKRYQTTYETFLKEVTKHITIDDLSLITRKAPDKLRK